MGEIFIKNCNKCIDENAEDPKRCFWGLRRNSFFDFVLFFLQVKSVGIRY
jgi:hypothetical protein